MKTKNIKIMFIITIILGVMVTMLNLNVYAVEYSFKTSASASKTTINAGETITITLTASNINMGEEGMHALEGMVTYSTDVFDLIDLKGNDWNVTLNSSTGKFVAVNLGEAGTSTSILTATLTAKENISSTQTGNVTFSSITSSAGDELINGDPQTVEITVNPKASNETISPSQGQTASNTEQTKQTEQSSIEADKTTSKSKIPATGISIYVIVALALGAIVSIVLIIKSNSMKDIK